MAIISIKNKRRYRVQISISKDLWERYNHNMELANQIGAEIDFSRDFGPWFSKQNDQVNQELQQLLQERQSEDVGSDPDGGNHHADH